MTFTSLPSVLSAPQSRGHSCCAPRAQDGLQLLILTISAGCSKQPL